MPIEDYGVWKASPVYYILEQHEDDPGSPHLSLYFDDRRGSTHHSGHKFSRTGGKRKKIYEPFRAAINIKSGNKHESRLVYWVNHDFHQHPIVNNLTDLSLGFHPLEDTEPVPASLRLDFIRSNLFKANTGRILPYDEPGRDNELIDVLEPEIKHAIDENADVYLFGAQFKTGNGIHDVHMNQGNIRQYKHDDGVFQDGGLLINYPHSGRWVGVFLGFASQAVHTNDISGHAISPETWVDYLSSEGKVIEKELIAAARNEREGPEVMARLLERRRYEVIITEKVVVAAASNEWRAVEVINLLLDKRGDEVKITEEVIVAAASNKRRGLKVMELLLEKRGTEVKVTEKVVVAAASNELEGTEVIDLLLQRRKEDDTAGDEYIWIRDLRSIGYSLQEIADLLLDKARDSPWIYFEPSDIRPYEIQSSRHIPGCAHQCCATHATRQTLESLSTEIDAKSVDTRNIAEIIDELCGIGGISPATRTMTDWIESAEFTEENRILAISYTPPTEQSPIHNFQNLNSRILRVLKGFCSAVGVTQANNLCCNSFTVLKLAHTNHESSSQDLGEVTPLNFKLVIDLVKALESAPKQVPQQFQFQGIILASRAILTCVSPKLAEAQGESDIQWCLHICALAVQFLCVGFLSYTQAHIGPLKPFFLETPVQKVTLRGLGDFTQFPYLVAELVTLSCFGDLTRGPVLVFRDNEEWGQHTISEAPKDRQKSKRYDILGCTEDILDTWGPGNLIFPSTTKAHPYCPIAIQIGDGYIFSTDAGKYHWAEEVKDNQGLIAIDLSMALTIGALVAVNSTCRLDEAVCWDASGNQLQDLGEYSSLWEKSQRQTGHQVGHSAHRQRIRAWNKREKNRPIKDRALENPREYMDRYFGIQVSYCTGVARRVLLRTLVADLIPIFSERLGVKISDVESLRGNTWNDWFNFLEKDSKEIKMIRTILTSLQPTGFDPSKHTFCVAWPFKGERCRCFNITSWRKNSWINILEDSSDCATFAYITMQCLETDDIKCRATTEHQHEMSILETAVTHSPQGGLLPSETIQNRRIYVFKMLNNTVWVKALRENANQPAKLIGLLYSESLPYVIQRRLYLIERKKQRDRLLERSTSQDPGEDVSICSIRSSIFL